jgi:dGTPase
MNIREEQEKREHLIFSPYASFSDESRGRDRDEEPCPMRTIYQRDRDRIIHCKAFRRLKHKTQVFLAPEGDHYRTRLTHTLEVAQIARSIARALNLNEDLTEAIALGHDLGHTPFGHAGERTLNSLCPMGFAHYRQSIRVVEFLEKDGQGLNLTWEVRDGILNHRTSGNPSTLEGKAVRLSDKIAYINHDIDDGIRAGILKESDIPSEYTDVLGNSTKERLNTMISDIIMNSIGKNDLVMSEPVRKAMTELRKFMFESLYLNPTAKSEEAKADKLITELYRYYVANTDKLPDTYKRFITEFDERPEQVVCDYIAGMSDQYSISTLSVYLFNSLACPGVSAVPSDATAWLKPA